MPRRKSKLLRRTQLRPIEQLVAETTASKAAERGGVNCNTAMLYYPNRCEIIAGESPFSGEVKFVESY